MKLSLSKRKISVILVTWKVSWYIWIYSLKGDHFWGNMWLQSRGLMTLSLENKIPSVKCLTIRICLEDASRVRIHALIKKLEKQFSLKENLEGERAQSHIWGMHKFKSYVRKPCSSHILRLCTRIPDPLRSLFHSFFNSAQWGWIVSQPRRKSQGTFPWKA